ncbi:H+-transporting two-sector ATPase, alpha/beta subunit, central region [Thermoproteus uzoniensis 768-20]|uniref:A-type ATP synthase subunit B n=1 Tax=Thermoproteus uzoniensis (strain 768-20) TaxID=999630 RepID=F2L548_THEU7|nr:V-type ATP synthase subunit B [Thermoproteus uzoniensis]AEA12297.1 H+-transporting two-sector ATPase, alpha/beta subunit, central region [Thermoproteus uzoniensis 768-20]
MQVSPIVSYSTVREVKGPLLVIERTRGVAYGELGEVVGPDGEPRRVQVIEVGTDYAVAQVLGPTLGLPAKGSTVRFYGKTYRLGVSEDLIGRILDGKGQPRDHMPLPPPQDFRDINGEPLNPYAREYPEEPIETGISAIDGLYTLVRGQKLPIFSGTGLPHNVMAAQVVRQATVRGSEEGFAVVFVGIGIRSEEAMYFMDEFRRTGALRRAVAVINLASDPVAERILAPRVGLTIAEHLAWDLGYHVLVVITDMTNYAEGLRELSSGKGELPGRRGYPGYMYTDLASIYERAGRARGRKGSVTQFPILTMPHDDITHPIPDLSGYITEGQLVLSRSMWGKGIYPPFDIIMSLSRLAKDAIGEGKTREDHKDVANTLIAAYSRALELRSLATLVGERNLGWRERRYLRFADAFEQKFVKQGVYERRTFEETLDIGWDVLSILPEDELTNARPEISAKYYRKHIFESVAL